MTRDAVLSTHSHTQVASAFPSTPAVIGPLARPSYFPNPNLRVIGCKGTSGDSTHAIG